MPFECIISEKEWDKEWNNAEHYFDKNPNAFKYDRKIKLSFFGIQRKITVRKCSFIKVEHIIYAVANEKEHIPNLGEGDFGVVKIVKNRKRESYALKIESSNLKEKAEEIEIMNKIKYLHGIGERKDTNMYVTFKKSEIKKPATTKVYAVTELRKGMSLEKVIEAHRLGKKILTKVQQIDLSLKACQAIQFLHKERIIHRDIKPSNFNVYVNEKGEFEVTSLDYGLSKILPQDKKEIEMEKSIGGIQAPEIRQTYSYYWGEFEKTGKPAIYSFASDIFALGESICDFDEIKKIATTEYIIDYMQHEDRNKRPSLYHVINKLTELKIKAEI